MKTILTSLLVFFIFNITSYSQITQAWVRTYNGPGNGNDQANAMVLDTSGNIYVTGTGTASGNNINYITIKYNSAGTVQWLQSYDNNTSTDIASGIAVDKAGNVYVTGHSIGVGNDIATVKYNSSGVQQWVHRYDGPGNSDDYPSGIVVDSLGEIYVTGYSRGVNNDYDIVTIKYTASGPLPLWIKRYNGTGNSTDQGYGLAVDNSGNVYVTGNSIGIGTGIDYITIKYNPFGTLLWEQRYNGTANDEDYARDIALDNSGNVYVTGSSVGIGSSSDCLTIKYNNSGALQWEQRYNGPANSIDNGGFVRLDVNGNVYVAGNSEGIGTSTDYILVKYNSSGVQQWAQRYNGPQNAQDFTTDMVLDKNNYIYVAGSSVGASNDFASLKYNFAGVVQWEQRYNGTANLIDIPNSIAVDKSGNVYIAGVTYVAANSSDFIILKYTQQVGINTISNEVPSGFSLKQNYPNPFNPVTNIKFDMQKGDFVSVKIFNALGKEIETLVNEYKPAGMYEITFDAGRFESGIYFYKMETNGFSETKKMILVK
ncbi:MAG: SBBP repeat-containing protein [Bacteroidetes bacterium]|nr:SBBP repeat-containing protein [Bacteroidota bacterium]